MIHLTEQYYCRYCRAVTPGHLRRRSLWFRCSQCRRSTNKVHPSGVGPAEGGMGKAEKAGKMDAVLAMAVGL